MHGFERKGDIYDMQNLIRAGWDVNLTLRYQMTDVPEVKVILCDTLWTINSEGHFYNPENLVWCDNISELIGKPF
jgi:hypothetical protein